MSCAHDILRIAPEMHHAHQILSYALDLVGCAYKTLSRVRKILNTVSGSCRHKLVSPTYSFLSRVDSLSHLNLVHNLVSVCVEVLRPSQPNGVMSSAVSLPNHTFTGQA